MKDSNPPTIVISYAKVTRDVDAVVLIDAGCTRDGNPRRAYIVILDQDVIDVIEVGYRGRGILQESGYKGPIVAMIPTTPSGYKEFIALGKLLRKEEGRK